MLPSNNTVPGKSKSITMAVLTVKYFTISTFPDVAFTQPVEGNNKGGNRRVSSWESSSSNGFEDDPDGVLVFKVLLLVTVIVAVFTLGGRLKFEEQVHVTGTGKLLAVNTPEEPGHTEEGPSILGATE